MDSKLNLKGKLDFSEIDLTAPEKVIKEVLSALPGETNEIVFGEIIKYDGPVKSYTKTGFANLCTIVNDG